MTTGLKTANKTSLMSEVTVNDKLRIGHLFQKDGTIIFFSKAGFDPTIIYRYPAFI
jgi:hypothetical protein